MACHIGLTIPCTRYCTHSFQRLHFASLIKVLEIKDMSDFPQAHPWRLVSVLDEICSKLKWGEAMLESLWRNGPSLGWCRFRPASSANLQLSRSGSGGSLVWSFSSSPSLRFTSSKVWSTACCRSSPITMGTSKDEEKSCRAGKETSSKGNMCGLCSAAKTWCSYLVQIGNGELFE